MSVVLLGNARGFIPIDPGMRRVLPRAYDGRQRWGAERRQRRRAERRQRRRAERRQRWGAERRLRRRLRPDVRRRGSVLRRGARGEGVDESRGREGAVGGGFALGGSRGASGGGERGGPRGPGGRRAGHDIDDERLPESQWTVLDAATERTGALLVTGVVEGGPLRFGARQACQACVAVGAWCGSAAAATEDHEHDQTASELGWRRVYGHERVRLRARMASSFEASHDKHQQLRQTVIRRGPKPMLRLNRWRVAQRGMEHVLRVLPLWGIISDGQGIVGSLIVYKRMGRGV